MSCCQLDFDRIDHAGDAVLDDAIIDEIVYIAKPSLRATCTPKRGAAPSVLCKVAGATSLRWLSYDSVFSRSMLSKTATNAKYISTGKPPEYLRRPGLFGMRNFKDSSYWQIEQFCRLNCGFSNFNKGKKRKGRTTKKRRLEYGDDDSFAMKPIVVSIEDSRVERACDAIINFVTRNKNPNTSVGGLAVKGITNFTGIKNNVIQGFGSYSNVVRKESNKQQRSKTIVWGVDNPSTNLTGGYTISFVQFIKDLEQFKVVGAASWRELLKFAVEVASTQSGLELHEEPLIVHFLEQMGKHPCPRSLARSLTHLVSHACRRIGIQGTRRHGTRRVRHPRSGVMHNQAGSGYLPWSWFLALSVWR